MRLTLGLVFLILFSSIITASKGLVCDFDEHICETTSKCISKDYLCDGDNDCGDSSDENVELCKSYYEHTLAYITRESTCEPGQFQCSTKCISYLWLCDGDADCDNGEDEEIQHCLQSPFSTTARSSTTKAPCRASQFDCGEKCIRESWVCDGYPDCNRANDEALQLCSIVLKTTTDNYESRMTPEFFHSTTDNYESRMTPKFLHSTTDNYESRMHPEFFQTTTDYNESKKSEVFFETTTDNYESRMSSVFFQTFTEKTTFVSWKEKQLHQQTTFSDNTDNSKITNMQRPKLHLSTTTTKSSEVENEWEPPQKTASIFTRLSWLECLLIVFVLLLIVIATTTFVCIKRRKYSANLNSRAVENRTPAVSYLNSPATPDCQLVIVKGAVHLEPVIIQSTTSDTHLGQPPPYDTLSSTIQPSRSNQHTQNFSKGHECLV